MRNFNYITMMAQFGGKGGVMKDRRAPRGGAKNEERDYLNEYYEEQAEEEEQAR